MKQFPVYFEGQKVGQAGYTEAVIHLVRTQFPEAHAKGIKPFLARGEMAHRMGHPEGVWLVASADQNLVRLRLEFDAVISPNGVPSETLTGNLLGIIDDALQVGRVTGDSEAELEDWETKVSDQPLDTERPAIPRHHMSEGDAAAEAFDSAINSAFQDDATGTIVGYKLDSGRPVAVDLYPVIDETFDGEGYDLIIVDSGNSAGDVWKYVYHPQQRVGTFINEAG